jgi:hypothetical protein
MATGGQFDWPPAGIFVAAYGQFFMAANIKVLYRSTSPCTNRCLGTRSDLL